MDRIEINSDEKSYVHRQHRQFLMTKERYDTSKDIDTHIYIAQDIMFTKIPAKEIIKQFGER